MPPPRNWMRGTAPGSGVHDSAVSNENGVPAAGDVITGTAGTSSVMRTGSKGPTAVIVDGRLNVPASHAAAVPNSCVSGISGSTGGSLIPPTVNRDEMEVLFTFRAERYERRSVII